MALDFNRVVGQGKAFWTNLPGSRKIILVGAAVVTLGAMLFLSTRKADSEPYELLFAGLGPEDTAHIEGQLKQMGVPFKKDAAGGSLRVPTSRVSEVRVQLAGSGYPRRGGVGFEIFDKQSFGTTGFVEQMNYRRALQGELERTITGLGAIENARVHIAIPEHSLYRNEETTPTASVVVKMYPGRALSPAQVKGIVNLVAFSVPKMTPERVSLVDDSGRVLSEDQAQSGLDAQQEMEANYTQRVKQILEPIVGVGHVEVQVTADMDFTKVTTTEERFDKDNAVIRSEQRTEDFSGSGGVGAGASAGGVAGVQGNLPGAPAPTSGTDTGRGSGRLSETKNYEISKSVQQSAAQLPKIKRLHVAILVDGVPDPAWKPPEPEKKEGEAAAGAEGEAKDGEEAAADKKDKKPGEEPKAPIIPRTDAELARLANLARQAVGFDEARGDKLEIQSSSFVVPPPLPPPEDKNPWPMWARNPRNQLLLKAGAAMAGVLIGLLLLVLVVRSLRGGAPDETMLLPALPTPVRDVEVSLPNMPNIILTDAAGGAGEAGELSSGAAPESAQLPAAPSAPARPRELAAEAAKKDIPRTVRVLSNWLNEPVSFGGR